MKKIFLLTVLIAAGTLCGANSEKLVAGGGVIPDNIKPGATLNPVERHTVPFLTDEVLDLPQDQWKIKIGDDPAFSAPDFDDSQWQTGKTGMALSTQGIKGKGPAWYRLRFTLPENFAGKDLLLSLGAISVFDHTFVNGEKMPVVGRFPKPLTGSSWLHRKYFVPAGKLKAGENVIAVRVMRGSGDGMYRGKQQIFTLKSDFSVRYNLKLRSSNAVYTLLSDAEHLNRFVPGQPLVISMHLTRFGGENAKGWVRAKLVDANGKILQTRQTATLVAPGKWSRENKMLFTAPKRGKYQMQLTFEVNGDVVWNQVLPLEVATKRTFTLPVDKTLAKEKFTIDISGKSAGHFGPRSFDGNKAVENFDFRTSNGGLTFSVVATPQLPMPLIYQANVRPVPENRPKATFFSVPKGNNYDGLYDAWIFGGVGVRDSGKVQSVNVKADWVQKTWQYQYENVNKFNFTISTINPAWQLETDGKVVRIFDNITHYGIGLPSYISGDFNGKPATVPAAKGITGQEMSANYIVAYFHGSKNWNEFDVPWLIVFQNKPLSVKVNDGALEATFAEEAGIIRAMPLFGVTLQSVRSTANWSKRFSGAGVARTWAKRLTMLPVGVKRRAMVDFKRDRVAYCDTFNYSPLNDQWHTQGGKWAPVSPLFTLAASSGNIKMALHTVSKDSTLATLHGPYMLVPNHKVIAGIDGMLKFVREERVVTPGNSPEYQAAQQKLAAWVEKNISHIEKSPWDRFIWRGKFNPGCPRAIMCELVLALPNLPPELQQKVRNAIDANMGQYTFHTGIAPEALLPKMLPKLRNQPVEVTINTALPGVTLETFRPQEHDYGIDSVCFANFHLHSLYYYARNFDKHDFIKANWERVQRIFNWTPYTHDWALGISYDTLSGIRVGNGLQETGVALGGMASYARMAHKLGKFADRDRAAYYAVMQITGLQGALSANGFIRDWRPTLATASTARMTFVCEYYLPMHFVEFNELGGMTAHCMNSPASVQNYTSYIHDTLPEVMRPYKEVWYKQSQQFFDPFNKMPFCRTVAGPIPLDMYLYMTRDYPIPFEQVIKERQMENLDWLRRLADYRAECDYYSKVEHKKLW